MAIGIGIPIPILDEKFCIILQLKMRIFTAL